MKFILIFFIVLEFSYADMFTPSHFCSKPVKPYKPYSFSSQWEIDNYNNQIDSFYDDVERYKSCIQDFVDEQNNQSNNHINAAQEAIDDWNRFVNYELK